MRVARVAFDIRVDTAEVDKILSALAAIPGASVRAAQRAGSKTLTASATVVRRDIATRSQIPQRAIRGRFFLRRPSRRDLRASMWVGVEPVRASALGELRKGRKGYHVGRRYFPSAFEATMPSGHTGVFVRAPEGYRTRRGSRGWTKGRPNTSSQNLPIIEPFVPLQYRTDYSVDMTGRYLTLLKQEVRFEVEKAAGRIKR